MEMPDAEKLCSFLVNARIKLKKSQRKIADELGHDTAQFVSNFERGISRPPITSLRKVAQIYGVSSHELYRLYEAAVLEEITVNLTKKFFEAR